LAKRLKESYLLDTHAAIWLALESDRLSTTARAALVGVAPENLFLSDITLSETARLLRQGRLATAADPADWIERFALGFTILPVTAAIAWGAAALEWEHRDPSDRHILASAAVLHLPLVTLDPKIASFAPTVGVRTLW
jgi:PIN domain nuclease of toxin-antitoxin system